MRASSQCVFPEEVLPASQANPSASIACRFAALPRADPALCCPPGTATQSTAATHHCQHSGTKSATPFARSILRNTPLRSRSNRPSLCVPIARVYERLPDTPPSTLPDELQTAALGCRLALPPAGRWLPVRDSHDHAATDSVAMRVSAFLQTRAETPSIPAANVWS